MCYTTSGTATTSAPPLDECHISHHTLAETTERTKTLHIKSRFSRAVCLQFLAASPSLVISCAQVGWFFDRHRRSIPGTSCLPSSKSTIAGLLFTSARRRSHIKQSRIEEGLVGARRHSVLTNMEFASEQQCESFAVFSTTQCRAVDTACDRCFV